jgi:hypothetical protein
MLLPGLTTDRQARFYMPNTRNKQSNAEQPERASKRRRWIGTMELAALLGCHPFSIPRYVRTKPGFPQPRKPFGKNLWDEAEAEAYLQTLLAQKTQATA